MSEKMNLKERVIEILKESKKGFEAKELAQEFKVHYKNAYEEKKKKYNDEEACIKQIGAEISALNLPHFIQKSKEGTQNTTFKYDISYGEKIENFLINNIELDKLETKLHHFNPFKILKIEDSETCHSNMLAWLLNPKENHGLGDTFLTRFLSLALQNKEDNTELSISAQEVVLANLHDAVVEKEYFLKKDKDNSGRIDILIRIPSLSWIFIIENKIKSTQGDNQLGKYWDAIQKEYIGEEYKKVGIFLTLNDEEFKHDSYVPLKYQDISPQLKNLIEIKQEVLSSRIRNFIQYYIDIIEQQYDKNEKTNEAIEIADSLYKNNEKTVNLLEQEYKQNKDNLAPLLEENRTTIEFLIKNGITKPFEIAIGNIFNNHETLEYLKMRENGNTCVFIPNSWKNFIDDNNIIGKTLTLPYPVINTIVFSKKTDIEYEIKVQCILGEIENEDRKKSLENIVGGYIYEIGNEKKYFKSDKAQKCSAPFNILTNTSNKELSKTIEIAEDLDTEAQRQLLVENINELLKVFISNEKNITDHVASQLEKHYSKKER